MKKYVLYENRAEVKKVYELCTYDENSDSEEVKVFDNKEEALEELKNYESSVIDFGRYYLVTEFYIQEEERNEDDEILDSSFGILENSKLPDKYAEFYINEKSEPFSRKKYTFEEVKEFFKREADDDNDWYEFEKENDKIDACYDLEELIDLLTKLAGGMEFTYKIEKC